MGRISICQITVTFLILASSSLKLFISEVHLAQFGEDDSFHRPNRPQIVTNFKASDIVLPRSASTEILTSVTTRDTCIP